MQAFMHPRSRFALGWFCALILLAGLHSTKAFITDCSKPIMLGEVKFKDATLEEVRTAVADPDRFLAGPLDENIQILPRELQYMINGVISELARLDVSHAGAPGLANVLQDDNKPRNSAVFLRGQVQNPGPVVPRQFLEVLSGPERKPFTQGSGRLELAEAIASNAP